MTVTLLFFFYHFFVIQCATVEERKKFNLHENRKIESVSENRLPAIRGRSSETVHSLKTWFPTNVLECMSWECVCDHVEGAKWIKKTCHMPGGTIMRKEVRKEYRMLTISEKRIYRRAFLLANKPGGIYNILSNAHSDSSLSPAAHNGPHFLPWHREFLKRLIIGIRLIEENGKYPFASVSLPYWDSSLDDHMRERLNISSTNSVLFSPHLMGSVVKGILVDGDFAGFVGNHGHTRRELDRFGRKIGLLKRQDVERMVNSYNITGVLSAAAGSSRECTKKLPRNALELLHGNAHVWVGGSMKLTRNATNDPIFVLHHSFVDMLWERWRKKKQNSKERESQWNDMTKCYSSHHKSSAVMKPFGLLTGKDGCSNKYAEMTSYSPIPKCHSFCRSKYLYCHEGYCVSRLKPNGQCRIINRIDPCYRSKCTARDGHIGYCKPYKTSIRDTKKSVRQKTSKKQLRLETCFNMHECCNFWGKQGECNKRSNAMSEACPLSCGVCKAKTYNNRDDCTDRHFNCEHLRKLGGCKTSYPFMAENCRKTCGFCSRRRNQNCLAPPSVKQILHSKKTAKQARVKLRSLFT
ncbi:unnamed protein product [Auanema sp. JU1783]|nr:unnamed protein product [Auanema sp. JU1783]